MTIANVEKSVEDRLLAIAAGDRPESLPETGPDVWLNSLPPAGQDWLPAAGLDVRLESQVDARPDGHPEARPTAGSARLPEAWPESVTSVVEWAPVDEVTRKRTELPDALPLATQPFPQQPQPSALSLNWSAQSDLTHSHSTGHEETRVSSAQKKVIAAYSALHGHPHEHDGRIAQAERAVRWKIGQRSAFAIVIVVGVVCGGALAVQQWNSASATAAISAADGATRKDAVAVSGDQGDGVGSESGLEDQVFDPDGSSSEETSTAQSVSAGTAVEQGEAARSDDGANPSESSGQVVTVHVAGAVKKSDVYELSQGARVSDAVNAAGGFAKKADKDALNLARIIQDGEQIYVPRLGESAGGAGGLGAGGQSAGSVGESRSGAQASAGSSTGSGGSATGSSSASGTTININTATLTELDTLPGVGPAIAQRIIDFRTENGPFASPDDLQSVSGIGPSIMSKISDLVTVSAG